MLGILVRNPNRLPHSLICTHTRMKESNNICFTVLINVSHEYVEGLTPLHLVQYRPIQSIYVSPPLTTFLPSFINFPAPNITPILTINLVPKV